ncbi:MAG: DUF2523 domain-containing protein [Candidatus Competibacter sp.]|nr:DUF2523 domain-containing protein [Candidatus Competibacter sp.]
MESLINWIANFILVIWQDILNFLNDFWVSIAKDVLDALASTIETIPVPHFLEAYSLQSIILMLPSELLYFVGLLHLGEGLALIGAAVTFRMGRKVVTLFQW